MHIFNIPIHIADKMSEFRVCRASSVAELYEDHPSNKTLHTLVLRVVNRTEMVCYLSEQTVKVSFHQNCLDQRKYMRKRPQGKFYAVFNPPIPLYPPTGSIIKVVAKNLFEEGIEILRWHEPSERAELDAHRLENVVDKIRLRQQETANAEKARQLALSEEPSKRYASGVIGESGGCQPSSSGDGNK